MAKRSSENKEFTFTWIIENFNFFRSLNPKYETLRSPLFNLNTITNATSWYLSIHLCKANTYDFYLINPNILAGRDNDVSASYKIVIIDNNGKYLHSSDFNACVLTNDEYQVSILEKLNLINVNAMTICFTMIVQETTDLVYECNARTKIKVKQSSFIWNVENFLAVAERSKTFPCSEWTHINIRLSKFKDIVEINLDRVKLKRLERCFISCKISLLNISGAEKDSRESEYLFAGDESPWIFPRFIKISDLLSGKGKYLKYNTFSLKCEFSFSNGETLEEIDKDNAIAHNSTIATDPVSNLQNDIHRMYVEKVHTDLKLQVENQTLLAHKCVLSTRSPVFAAMFDQGMLETQTGIVDIPDVEFQILDLFLRFMYGGTVPNMNYLTAYKLLVIADKYQVPILKEMCSTYLSSNLNRENACDVLMLADKVSHETLKDSAVSYIVKHASTMLPTEAWSNFIQTNIKLATDVLCKLSVLYS